METLWQDIRYGLRMLSKSPFFTGLAALTLALGIGANAAIFSTVNGLLFTGLPYPEADRVIQIWDANKERGWTGASISFQNFRDWRERNRTFEDMALYSGAAHNLTGAGEPVRIRSVIASTNLFSVLKRTPALGRAFVEKEDEPGASPVVILSHGLWQRSFAGDKNILGKTIALDGEPHTVVGVMPADFYFPGAQTEAWMPHRLDPAKWPRGSRSFAAVGRLKARVTLEQARAEMTNLAAQLAQEFPDENKGWSVNLITRFDEMFDEDLQVIMAMLYVSVGFVLLIACANVANLLLARAATREREIAIRMALGGGRVRLLRQMLTESVLLAVLGGIGGVVVAYWSIRGILVIAPPDMPNAAHITLSPTVLFYTAAISLLTGLIFGIAPALQATRPNLQEALKEAGRTGSGGSRHSALKTLVVTEVALALVLLICGGLMVRSFVAQVKTEPGFDTKNLLTMRVSLPPLKYDTPAKQAAFYREAVERLAALPGVEAAAAVQTLPLDGSNSWRGVDIEGHPVTDPGQRISVGYLIVTPDYFRAMKIPLLHGRAFTEQDAENAPRGIIVNETMARQYWPEQPNAVGRRVRFTTNDKEPWMTVIGVVRDVRHQNLARPPRPELYVTHAQFPTRAMTLVVRTKTEPLALASAAREAITAVDRDQPIYALRTMEQVITDRVAGEKATAQVMGILSLLALALAAVGIYGVIAYTVSERTQEIGIRMALGAQQGDILRLVLRQGMALVGIGVALGLGGAFGLMRLLQSILVGVTPTDPLTYSTNAVFLLIVALLASYFPARRAMRVSPIEALRYE